MLAVALVTDELDCSVQTPGGYSFFTDPDNSVYWNTNPQAGNQPQPTSAICFNAGVTCTDVDGDGIYEDGCAAQDNEVLQPLARYTSYFEYLEDQGKEVVMLAMTGVPQVVAHNPNPPYEPIAGGALDVVYRTWFDFPFPNGDILPDEWAMGTTADDKVYAFGALGPGCTAQDQLGDFTGQALPPVRIRDVCQSLDDVDPETGAPNVRCCIESICDQDSSPAFRCLTGIVAQALERSDP
ncbi:MAG: hypothetical protein KDK70_02400 [Myxococcales bacterium]|nr:hypothetical protein [Myxococcales bacterium]